jgi:hypothetical protein
MKRPIFSTCGVWGGCGGCFFAGKSTDMLLLTKTVKTVRRHLRQKYIFVALLERDQIQKVH